ncbi:Aspartate decarboxylase [Rhodopirellula maiorica SM1]|uniref:Aspartate 1-decarboxylase n=1 Tax=Rhodopirellula maiorica SM1 TaxID=1265738 RepID=M5RNP5_9BACT|nr:aspartate 1-decarboxylase [Rhodopirellula maiorica]EMI20920.1 Aspartate decarboxylase [Rhodopirellula maiorica SM1]
MTGPFRKLLSAKIHRATVTGADVDYEGSVTIPPELLEASGICAYESVHVWNVTRGTRLETYAIPGTPGSNDVCMNGAAAHLVHPGDRVILATYTMVPEDKVAEHRPRLVFVDAENQIKHLGPEIAGPQRRSADETASTPQDDKAVQTAKGC